MKKVPDLQVNAIQCGKCGDTIFSRARHDFRSCSCGGCHIDGGFDYIKCSGNPAMITQKSVTLKGVTKKMLYDDWALMKDKYGVIRG